MVNKALIWKAVVKQKKKERLNKRYCNKVEFERRKIMYDRLSWAFNAYSNIHFYIHKRNLIKKQTNKKIRTKLSGNASIESFINIYVLYSNTRAEILKPKYTELLELRRIFLWNIYYNNLYIHISICNSTYILRGMWIVGEQL